MNNAMFKRYDPFCSFNCAEWWRLEEAQRYLRMRQTEINDEL